MNFLKLFKVLVLFISIWVALIYVAACAVCSITNAYNTHVKSQIELNNYLEK